VLIGAEYGVVVGVRFSGKPTLDSIVCTRASSGNRYHCTANAEVTATTGIYDHHQPTTATDFYVDAPIDLLGSQPDEGALTQNRQSVIIPILN
jgi:hypothetical protein